MPRYLVTGGAGFLGSHLAKALVARGDEVRVLDDFSTGNPEHLASVAHLVEVHEGAVGDRALLNRLLPGIDCVFHFAAPPDRVDGSDDPTAENNPFANDTLALLSAARHTGVRRVVYASSGQVYGKNRGPVKESDAALPLSRAGLAKLIGEHHCANFSDLYGLETVRLRYFNVFGQCQARHQPYSQTIAMLLGAARARKEFAHLENAGLQDYLYVDDAVYGTLLAADNSRAAGRVYNIARGRSAEPESILSTLNEVLGSHTRLLQSECDTGGRIPASVDISRAERELGFCPATDLRQDLLRYLESQSSAPLCCVAGDCLTTR